MPRRDHNHGEDMADDDIPTPDHIATVDIGFDDDFNVINIDVVSFDVGGDYDVIHNDHTTVYRVIGALIDEWPTVVRNAIDDHAAKAAGTEVKP
jgi:hypothetical protein